MKTSWNGKEPNTKDRGESLSMNLAKVVSYDNLNLKKPYIYIYKYCRSVMVYFTTSVLLIMLENAKTKEEKQRLLLFIYGKING